MKLRNFLAEKIGCESEDLFSKLNQEKEILELLSKNIARHLPQGDVNLGQQVKECFALMPEGYLFRETLIKRIIEHFEEREFTFSDRNRDVLTFKKPKETKVVSVESTDGKTTICVLAPL